MDETETSPRDGRPSEEAEPVQEETNEKESFAFRLLNHVQGSSAVFNGLTLPELDTLSQFVKVLKPRHNEVVVKVNTLSNWFGVVCRGYLQMVQGGEKCGFIKVGQMIGDTELFSLSEFNYLLTNQSKRTVILAVPYTSLATINHQFPDLGLKLYQICGRSATAKLREATVVAHGEEVFPNNNNSEVGLDNLRKDLRKVHLKTKCFGQSFGEFDTGVLVENMYFRWIKQGHQIFSKGQFAKYVVLVMRGRLEVRAHGPKSRVMAIKRAGEFVGQEEFILSFFDDSTVLSTRPTDVYVKTDSAVLAILSKATWEQMNESEPEVAWKLLRQLTAQAVLDLMKRRNLAFKWDNMRLERLKQNIRLEEGFNDDMEDDFDDDDDNNDDDDADAAAVDDEPPQPLPEEAPIAKQGDDLTDYLLKHTRHEPPSDATTEGAGAAEGAEDSATDMLSNANQTTESFINAKRTSLQRSRTTIRNINVDELFKNDDELEDLVTEPGGEDETSLCTTRNLAAKFKSAVRMVLTRVNVQKEQKHQSDLLNASINNSELKTKKELMELYNMGFLFGKVEDDVSVTPQETFELMSYAAGYSQYWRGFISGELEVLSKVMILQRVQKGEQMLVSGEAATFFGLVISGSVKVHDPRYNVNRVLEQGALIGNSELCVGGVRFYDAWAAEECIIGIFSYADIIQLNVSCPELGGKIFQKLTFAAVHELHQEVNGIDEMERLQVPEAGAEPLSDDKAEELAEMLGTTVLGKKMKPELVRQLVSYFSPPRVIMRSEKVLRVRQKSCGVLMVVDGTVETKHDRITAKTLQTVKRGNVVGQQGLLQGGGFNAHLVRLYNAFCTSETATVTMLTFDRLSDLNCVNPNLARDIFFRIIKHFIDDLRNLHKEAAKTAELKIKHPERFLSLAAAKETAPSPPRRHESPPRPAPTDTDTEPAPLAPVPVVTHRNLEGVETRSPSPPSLPPRAEPASTPEPERQPKAPEPEPPKVVLPRYMQHLTKEPRIVKESSGPLRDYLTLFPEYLEPREGEQMGIAGLPLSPSKTGRQFTDDVGLSGTTVNFSHVSSFGHAQFEPPPHQHGIQHKRWRYPGDPRVVVDPPLGLVPQKYSGLPPASPNPYLRYRHGFFAHESSSPPKYAPPPEPRFERRARENYFNQALKYDTDELPSSRGFRPGTTPGRFAPPYPTLALRGTQSAGLQGQGLQSEPSEENLTWDGFGWIEPDAVAMHHPSYVRHQFHPTSPAQIPLDYDKQSPGMRQRGPHPLTHVITDNGEVARYAAHLSAQRSEGTHHLRTPPRSPLRRVTSAQRGSPQRHTAYDARPQTAPDDPATDPYRPRAALPPKVPSEPFRPWTPSQIEQRLPPPSTKMSSRTEVPTVQFGIPIPRGESAKGAAGARTLPTFGEGTRPPHKAAMPGPGPLPVPISNITLVGPSGEHALLPLDAAHRWGGAGGFQRASTAPGGERPGSRQQRNPSFAQTTQVSVDNPGAADRARAMARSSGRIHREQLRGTPPAPGALAGGWEGYGGAASFMAPTRASTAHSRTQPVQETAEAWEKAELKAVAEEMRREERREERAARSRSRSSSASSGAAFFPHARATPANVTLSAIIQERRDFFYTQRFSNNRFTRVGPSGR